MIVYQTDANGIYIGEVECSLSPLDTEEVWLIPAGAVTKAPPTIPSNSVAIWNGKKWNIEEIPTVEEPEKEEIPTVEEPVEELPVLLPAPENVPSSAVIAEEK